MKSEFAIPDGPVALSGNSGKTCHKRTYRLESGFQSEFTCLVLMPRQGVPLMLRRMTYFLAALALLVVAGASANAQSETYDFDGVADMDPQPADPTDWFTSVNWNEGGFDPLPPFGPPIPALTTRVEIRTATFGVNAPEIHAGDAVAHQVRIGREEGAGLLTMTGGTLTLNNASPSNRFRVGAHEGSELGLPLEQLMPGTFNMSGGTLNAPSLWIGSGSYGEMNLSGGTVNVHENFYMDWSFDAKSVFNMSGGTVNIAGVLRMFRESTFNLSSGNVLITGSAEFGSADASPALPQTPDINATISGGLLAANGSMRVNGSVVVDGGILRAARFLETLSSGTIEVNPGGTVQFLNSQESVADITALVTAGVIKTSSPQGTGAFQISVVNIGGTDYTQLTLPAAQSNGDFDMNNVVNGTDFLIWQREFGGSLDGDDFNAWKTHFGSTVATGAASPAPEPASSVLALAGLLSARAARRSKRNDATEPA